MDDHQSIYYVYVMFVPFINVLIQQLQNKWPPLCTSIIKQLFLYFLDFDKVGIHATIIFLIDGA